ncbi:hypothetical protein MKW92_041559 [Papaver armeniacum]|nr:hypothetical protein MKW92_041559 [Papaver armeniacum]
MAFKAKLSLLVFLLSFFLLSAASCLGQRDPQQELEQCRQLCARHQRFRQQQCEQQCQERFEERQREQGRDKNTRDPQQEYLQCQRTCQQQERSQQQRCQQRCEQRRREQEREQQQDEQDPQREYQQCQQQPGQQQQCEQRCEERRRQQEREQQRDEQSPQREYQQLMPASRRQQEREQQEKGQRDVQHGNNPYFYDEQSFIDRYSTQEGYIRVLPKFTEQSNLLRGIENYRLAIFQANPNTFVIPSHWDADAVLFVVKGRGTISLVRQQNRESYNIKQGDVLRVPVVSLVYMINRDNSETLQIGKILVTISTPGQVREFFSSGDHEPESFYRVFRLHTRTPRERLDRLFGQQTQGVIIRASQEQVRELSRHASSSSEESHFWPKRGGQSSSGPFNILKKRATYSNNYGQLYEVDGNDYKQLQDLDLGVSFTNISQGGMLGPYYNTRSTKVLLVVEGNGRGRQEFEEEREQGQGVHYEKVSARLSPRSVFIVPAGHPVAIVASQNQNLQIVAFEINAQGNQRNFLAGTHKLYPNNLVVINQIEKVAMELGFNVPSSEVQEILNKQRESFFLPGPNQRQQQRGSHGLTRVSPRRDGSAKNFIPLTRVLLTRQFRTFCWPSNEKKSGVQFNGVLHWLTKKGDGLIYYQ